MVRLEIVPGQCSSIATVDTPIEAQRRVTGWHATLPILWTGPWCLQAPRVHGAGKQLGTIRSRDQGSNPGDDRDFLFGTASRPALESTQPHPDTFPRGKATRVWNWLHTSLYRPRQDPTAPRGSGSQDFHTSGTGRWQGCQPYALAALKPGEDPWYAFLLEDEWTPRPQCNRKDWINEKSQISLHGIEPVTFRLITRTFSYCGAHVCKSKDNSSFVFRLTSMKYRIFIVRRCVKPRSRLAFTRHNLKTPH